MPTYKYKNINIKLLNEYPDTDSDNDSEDYNEDFDIFFISYNTLRSSDSLIRDDDVPCLEKELF